MYEKGLLCTHFRPPWAEPKDCEFEVDGKLGKHMGTALSTSSCCNDYVKASLLTISWLASRGEPLSRDHCRSLRPTASDRGPITPYIPLEHC